MRTLLPLLTLCALLVVSLSQTGCSNDAQSKAPEEEEDAPAVPVEAATAENGAISAYYTGTASLEAEDEAMVVARASGVVEQIFVEEGNYVKAEQPLAKLDDDRLTLELERAQMELDKQQRVFERTKGLYDKNLVSEEEFETAKSNFETAQAARDLAQLDVEYTTIRAPFSGVVSERMIKAGNMVGTHEAAFRLTDFDPLLAVMHVPERELNKLRTGQTATLRLDALPDQTFTGTIDRISPVVDPETGTFKVTVEVRDESRTLKPGMFGRVRIVYDTHDGAILIPKAAVEAEDDAASVFVVRDDSAFRQVVQTGFQDDQHIEITEGLTPGDVVVTTGQSSLRDSTKVEVIN
ncbi:MAG: efflux RND transporter periplasmic adaptor subunit [Bacteroidetes bacterium]|jgi:membrane fusion protein (multidrug efflux system)|nr:efflux RND transporter periplasmic adaptor subunit [Bacteroidota bacterium]